MIQAITLLVIAALVAIDQVIKIAVVIRFAAGGSMDLGDQRHTGIHFARRRIYDKDMLHWPVPFSMDSLRSIDSYYCIFFKAKVQYPAAK